MLILLKQVTTMIMAMIAMIAMTMIAMMVISMIALPDLMPDNREIEIEAKIF
jgi:hypothetical protein